MSIDIKTLGLKSKYVFKQTHIRTSRDRGDIHRKLRQRVAPAIRDLESRGLINGFHHIIHEDIDLRLSSGDWPQYESRIKQILRVHSIPTDLADWEFVPSELYGGETGALLCCNNLEFNSRLSLALLELMNETDDQKDRQGQERLCPHQWVHYLCNQFGYLNRDQIIFELNDAFNWLRMLVCSQRRDPQVICDARHIIDWFKNMATQFERNLPSG